VDDHYLKDAESDAAKDEASERVNGVHDASEPRESSPPDGTDGEGIEDASDSNSPNIANDGDAANDADAPDVMDDGDAPDGHDQQDAPDGPQYPEVVVTGQQRPGAISIASGYVYWLNETEGDKPGSLMRMDLDGKNVTPLLSDLSNPIDLWALTAGVFFTQDFGALGGPPGVFAVDPAGQNLRPLADDQLGAGSVHAIKHWVYSAAWSSTSPPRIRKSDINSASPSTCYPYTGSVPGGRITVVSGDFSLDQVWFVDDAAPQVRRISSSCDGSSYQVFADNQPLVRAIVNSSDHVYWITASAVLSLAKDSPGKVPELVSSGRKDLSDLRGIAGNPWKLVFTDAGDNTVWYIDQAKKPITPAIVASNQHEPRGVAFSGNMFYWTNRASGEIVRAPVP
jgi:hypothetical protein